MDIQVPMLTYEEVARLVDHSQSQNYLYCIFPLLLNKLRSSTKALTMVIDMYDVKREMVSCNIIREGDILRMSNDEAIRSWFDYLATLSVDEFRVIVDNAYVLKQKNVVSELIRGVFGPNMTELVRVVNIGRFMYYLLHIRTHFGTNVCNDALSDYGMRLLDTSRNTQHVDDVKDMIYLLLEEIPTDRLIRSGIVTRSSI